jgi:prolyl-tRNA synthetase
LEGKVEVVKRVTKESQDIPIDEIVATIKGWIAEEVKNV